MPLTILSVFVLTIRQIIKFGAYYRWKTMSEWESDTSDILTLSQNEDESIQYTNGALPSPFDSRDWIAEQIYNKRSRGSRNTLPNRLDLRSDLQKVRNQGSQGTCAAQTAACMKEFQEKRDIDLNQHLSPQYIYNHRSNYPNSGMYGRDVMRILKEAGVWRETEFKYWSEDRPEEISEKVKTEARRHLIKSYARVETVDGLKESLVANGPCYISFPCYNSKKKFWIQNEGDDFRGGHAVTVVGYDENGFIIRNSWGDSWGDDGYTKYPYDEWNTHWEVWTTIDAESPEIDYPEPKKLCGQMCYCLDIMNI
jgi:C1A family cysteine protease